jgi:membrane associated rhomboid family serine protease
MNDILSGIKRNFNVARFTWLLIGFCTTLLIAIRLFETKEGITNETLTLFGAPSALDIYDFHYWGIVTNSFVHYQFWHFILNILGLLLLGTYVERRVGRLNFFLFGLFASTVTSGMQLAFSDDAGLGLSGVNYALFGFVFIRTFIDERFRMVTKNLALILMLVLIPLCQYGNMNWQWNVATIAMSSGFFFGFFVGLIPSNLKWLSWSVLSLSLLFSVGAIFYAPWSVQWNCLRGIKFHEKGDLKNAILFYEKSLAINNESLCAIDNLKIIRVDELSGQAFKAHMRGDYIKASMYYDAILKLDPNNQWAKENKKRLP